jgi:hypothetical protein
MVYAKMEKFKLNNRDENDKLVEKNLNKLISSLLKSEDSD